MGGVGNISYMPFEAAAFFHEREEMAFENCFNELFLPEFL